MPSLLDLKNIGDTCCPTTYLDSIMTFFLINLEISASTMGISAVLKLFFGRCSWHSAGTISNSMGRPLTVDNTSWSEVMPFHLARYADIQPALNVSIFPFK